MPRRSSQTQIRDISEMQWGAEANSDHLKAAHVLIFTQVEVKRYFSPFKKIKTNYFVVWCEAHLQESVEGLIRTLSSVTAAFETNHCAWFYPSWCDGWHFPEGATVSESLALWHPRDTIMDCETLFQLWPHPPACVNDHSDPAAMSRSAWWGRFGLVNDYGRGNQEEAERGGGRWDVIVERKTQKWRSQPGSSSVVRRNLSSWLSEEVSEKPHSLNNFFSPKRKSLRDHKRAGAHLPRRVFF